MNNFHDSMRRYDVENRLKASMDRTDAEALLDTVPETEKAKLNNYGVSDPAEYVVLNIPHGVGKITLEDGQHRRAAILTMNNVPVSARRGRFVMEHLDDAAVKVSQARPCLR